LTKIRLTAKPENLGEFLNFISGFAEQQDFPASRVKEMELVTEEALINIFNYAYPEHIGDVEMSCRKEGDSKLIVDLSDNGIPFDPLSLSEPNLTAKAADRKVGGLGVFFIRRMADAVRYRRERDANVLTLIFSK
jgi:anti-sigma regulatory factor (Ser/Thr protein kinase)